jgi:hypothetical protein
MNMMSLNRAAQAGSLAGYLLLISACNSSDPSPTAVRNPGQAGNETEILFSETFSDSGRFTISKDPVGGLTYNVQARIGSEAEKLLATSSAQPTLAEVYRTLHGGREDVPAVVAEVSMQLGVQTPDPSVNHQHATAPVALAALEKGASQSDFLAGYCRDIKESYYTWRPEGCFWTASENYYLTPWMDPGDRVYAWNNTPYTATMSIWNHGGGQPNTWRPTLQPYWVTWFQWGGTYSNAYAKINLPAGAYGELGLVVHFPIPIVK